MSKKITISLAVTGESSAIKKTINVSATSTDSALVAASKSFADLSTGTLSNVRKTDITDLDIDG